MRCSARHAYYAPLPDEETTPRYKGRALARRSWRQPLKPLLVIVHLLCISCGASKLGGTAMQRPMLIVETKLRQEQRLGGLRIKSSIGTLMPTLAATPLCQRLAG